MVLARCSKGKINGGGEGSNESGDGTDTSVTGDEQSFDEELYVGSRLPEQASGKGPSCGRARTEWGGCASVLG